MPGQAGHAAAGRDEPSGAASGGRLFVRPAFCVQGFFINFAVYEKDISHIALVRG